MRLVDADALMKCIPSEETASRFAVANAPTVDAVPVVHGKWIDEHYYSEHNSEHVYRCSECGWHMIAYPDELFYYCPICGARMVENE